MKCWCLVDILLSKCKKLGGLVLRLFMIEFNEICLFLRWKTMSQISNNLSNLNKWIAISNRNIENYDMIMSAKKAEKRAQSRCSKYFNVIRSLRYQFYCILVRYILPRDIILSDFSRSTKLDANPSFDECRLLYFL